MVMVTPCVTVTATSGPLLTCPVVAAICRLQASGNAVELLGTFEDRSCVYIVMEECHGGDLETLLEVSFAPLRVWAWDQGMLSSAVRCATQYSCSNRRLQSSAFQRSF